MNTLKSKIQGSIIGMAIGDAMGATTEFMSKEQIKRKYGVVDDIIGGGWLSLKPGEVTDDTQMSMCVIDAIMKEDDFELDCKNNFIKWLSTSPKDVGNQCLIGINELLNGNKFASVNEQSLGNGSLMRAIPCALIDNLDYNIVQGIMTHNSKICTSAISLYHKNINEYLKYGTETITVSTSDKLHKPTGYVMHSLNNAIYYASRSENFKDTMIAVVNDGGDADTIACITGGLIGAKFGIENVPEKWIEKLDKDVLKKLLNFANYAYEIRNKVFTNNKLYVII